MAGENWSRKEVEAIVADYLRMLALELAGSPYNKAEHRRLLAEKLKDRSEGSIEFKHANISAALIQAGLPFISGYKPRSNFQSVISDVVEQQIVSNEALLAIIEADVDRPMPVPEIDDILSVLTERPTGLQIPLLAGDPAGRPPRLPTDYLRREAANRSLGDSGEKFVLSYEQERLIQAGCENLASKIEHTAKVKGDHEGFDVLSFEENGRERLIEVKTTKYGRDTPFFATRNEIVTSEAHSAQYQVYRLYQFRDGPSLYTLPGAITTSCNLVPVTFQAAPR